MIFRTADGGTAAKGGNSAISFFQAQIEQDTGGRYAQKKERKK